MVICLTMVYFLTDFCYKLTTYMVRYLNYMVQFLRFQSDTTNNDVRNILLNIRKIGMIRIAPCTISACSGRRGVKKGGHREGVKDRLWKVNVLGGRFQGS